MAILGQRFSRKRPQYRETVYISRYTRHGVVSQIWPRKRGKPRIAADKCRRDVMLALTKAAKIVPGRELKPLKAALTKLRSKINQLKGSSSLRERDVLIQLASGTLWEIEMPDGKHWYTFAQRNIASYFLDHLEPLEGGLLTRGIDKWGSTVNCKPGAVLMSAPDGGAGTCCPVTRQATQSEAVVSGCG